MSIDRIGKGPGLPGAQGPAGASPVAPSKPFEVERSAGASGTAGAQAASGPSPAERVRGGQIDMKAYVDLRVDEATRHLEGRLAPADLEQVRSMLRSQIANDPAVREMVKAATGALPPDDEG